MSNFSIPTPKNYEELNKIKGPLTSSISENRRIVINFSDDYLSKVCEIGDLNASAGKSIINKFKDICKIKVEKFEELQPILLQYYNWKLIRFGDADRYQSIFGKFQYTEFFGEFILSGTCRVFGYFYTNSKDTMIFTVVLVKNSHIPTDKTKR